MNTKKINNNNGVEKMSNLIQVLAKMASDSSLHNEAAIEALLASNDINTEQSEAIIAKDVTSLERQLDICPDIVCVLLPAEDDDVPTEDESENEEDKKSVMNF